MILDPENILRLKKCRRELLSTLDFPLMTPALVQEKVLSPGEYETLNTTLGGNIEKVASIFTLNSAGLSSDDKIEIWGDFEGKLVILNINEY